MAAQGDRYKKLLTRYEALSTRAGAGESLVPDTAYADFLKYRVYPVYHIIGTRIWLKLVASNGCLYS